MPVGADRMFRYVCHANRIWTPSESWGGSGWQRRKGGGDREIGQALSCTKRVWNK